MLNDFRKDYLLDRWVVIATHRRQRPTDFAKKKVTTERFDKSACPFCPGNERMTPPAELVYLKTKKGTIRKAQDTDGLRHKEWLIRCVPNLYSAFSPPAEKKFKSDKAVGHHEVLIESPQHDEHPAVARIRQLVHVVNGYIDRVKFLSCQPYVKYVSIFRNHGLAAGASLSHAHSQVIATPRVPTILREELKASQAFFETHATCVFCNFLEKEVGSARFIWQNQSFAAFAPWAAVHPFEFWILPKQHQAKLSAMRPSMVKDFADALKTCLRGMRSLLNNPPYNYGFHIAPHADMEEYYHWHLEVYPKLTVWAGFEKSTGVYINVVPPEDAAHNLNQVIQQQ